MFQNPDPAFPERYWIPLIGMLSGLRLNEISPLYLDEIKEIDGITCFDINNDQDKMLKTRSSKRMVPIHPALIHLGLLEYAARQRQLGHQRFWSN